MRSANTRGMSAERRFENPATRESCLFRTITGIGGHDVLEMEYTIGVGGARVPEHAHPHATQRIRVLKGLLGLKVRGEVRLLTEGMEAVLPPNTNHSQWNAGDVPVVTVEQMDPPMEFEAFFESYCGLGANGRLRPDGNPFSFLQTVAWLFEFRETTSIAPPARYGMLALFGALYPVARLLGYRGRGS